MELWTKIYQASSVLFKTAFFFLIWLLTELLKILFEPLLFCLEFILVPRKTYQSRLFKKMV